MKKLVSFILILTLLCLVGCDGPSEEKQAEKDAFSAYGSARSALIGYNENCYCEAILIYHSLENGEQLFRISTERLGNDAFTKIERENEIAQTVMAATYKNGVMYTDLLVGETESKTAAPCDKNDFFAQYAISPAGLLPDLAQSDFAGAALKAADEGTLDESEEFGKDARILSLTLKPAQVSGILSAVELEKKADKISDLRCEMVFDADGNLAILLVQGTIAGTGGNDLFAITVGFDDLGKVDVISPPADADKYQ